MDTTYTPHQHEKEIYALWEKSGVFSPTLPKVEQNSNSPHISQKQNVIVKEPVSQQSRIKSTIKRSKKQEAFSIIMPPPNANDPLHIGHAMFVALEDVMIRFHRMLGKTTVWIPGTDHAGIETQYVFEKKLQKNKQSRFDFDRATLYNMIWEYVHQNSDVAISQIKQLGASADWSRYTFTLDKDVVDFVIDTFTKLHTDKLVYRDVQLVQYCTKCGTSYSELEVKHVERTTSLFYIKYPFQDNPQEHIVIATTRPEPIFVDTHLAVHPDNPKTKHLIGQKVLNPLTNTPMEIIADTFVDPEFGTGIVKLTPAHDPSDFAVAKQHNLPIIQAVSTQGKIIQPNGPYHGLSVAQAQKQVVEDLTAKDLIDHINTAYTHTVGTCYRCGRVLEPLPLPQFFIKVNDDTHSLTKKALEALDTKETVIHGAGREKILRHWLNNLKDWNISRQIVWGIRIPVWYNVAGHEDSVFVSFIDSNKEFKTGVLSQFLSHTSPQDTTTPQQYSLNTITAGLQQLLAGAEVPYVVSPEKPQEPGVWLPETDTFDTWFSSAQWPVVTLRTNQPQDFDTFYPTSVMETGYDILPFWVMRMMLMGIYLTGQSPFTHVYLHGLVRDEKGQKMSKSKGNVINPIKIVEEYGADALRMALVIRSTAGQDKSVSQQDIKSMRNFTNKIWNATRFVILQQEKTQQDGVFSNDEQFYATLSAVTQSITKNMLDFKLGLGAETAYNQFWHWYCDECIEQAKSGTVSPTALLNGLIVFLKLLHPFVPFVTETAWQELYAQKVVSEPLLMGAEWPKI